MMRLEVSYTVHLEGSRALHPGAGFGDVRVDRTVIREGGVPFVPGSHIRGVTRNRMEQLATTLGLTVGDPHINEELASRTPSSDPVARVFGTGAFDSITVFRDLRPTAAAPGSVSARRRVSIDRRTSTQRPGRLFDLEIWHAPQLEGSILAHLEGSEEQARLDVALLVGALRLVDSIGANRSVGLGACHIEVNAIRVGMAEVTLDEALEPLENLG